jgi:NADH-quinone oxidoreductase subunit F
MTPEAVVDAVKASGLRGRGGAGFPTGMKWQFVDKKSPKPKYICCNADESEPGTFKDHVLMERNPHLLFEGCLIGCHAIGAKVAYIYIRGEFYHVQLVLEAELAKARAAGYVGKNIFGTGFDCEIHIHRGAGAYEAGEETALIESLEGKRAQPRIKPPFPAVEGLWGCPTAVNNVETLCNVPFIIQNGPEWFSGIGPEKNGGPKLFCVSGHVAKPGVFETDMNVSLRDLIYDQKFAGGIRGGHQLKAVIPGGSSVPILLPHQLDIPGQLRRDRQGRFNAGLRGHHRDGRDHVHGLGGRESSVLLQARVVRQVHALPRRRRLAASSARQDRARRRPDARPRPADLGRQQHPGQDALRVWRRRSDACAVNCCAFPRGI